MSTRQPIDPAWWNQEEFDGVPIRQILAERDIKTVFQFLHKRGWSWGAIAQTTDIGEQRVREISCGKRGIENYDVYVRVAIGLNIPRDYLGVDLRPVNESGVLTGVVVAQMQEYSTHDFAVTLRGALERAMPVTEHDQPGLHHFESQVIQAWADRRHTGNRDTNLVLVAGFAGSGKSDFAKFLSTVTGWALLDKDEIARPLVESMLASLNGDPNDRHTEVYRTQVRPIEYRCLIDATFANIERGVSTVVTAPFLAEIVDPQWLRRLVHRCTTAGAHLEVVWVGADADTMHTYLQLRDAARDTWKLSHWDEYVASINLDLRPQIPHFYVDNYLNSAVQLSDQARRVSEWIAGSAPQRSSSTDRRPPVKTPSRPN